MGTQHIIRGVATASTLLLLGGLGSTQLVLAYESDQFTRRQDPLDPADALANARVDKLLDQAILMVNATTGCKAEDSALHLALARDIYKRVSDFTLVPPRGELPPQYYGAYAAWLETGPIDRHTFADRDDIYSAVQWWERPVLAFFGPASTISLGGIRVGTDKIDHFWVQGFLYFRKSRWGHDVARAVKWGVQTERSIWGQRTTGVFSYADLAANYSGYLFYSGLLSEDSIIQRAEQGCLARVGHFKWADWIDWHFDEVLNPSSYSPKVRVELNKRLQAQRASMCDQPPPSNTHQLQATRGERYVNSSAPPRDNPFSREAICGAAKSPPFEENGRTGEGWVGLRALGRRLLSWSYQSGS